MERNGSLAHGRWNIPCRSGVAGIRVVERSHRLLTCRAGAVGTSHRPAPRRRRDSRSLPPPAGDACFRRGERDRSRCHGRAGTHRTARALPSRRIGGRLRGRHGLLRSCIRRHRGGRRGRGSLSPGQFVGSARQAPGIEDDRTRSGRLDHRSLGTGGGVLRRRRDFRRLGGVSLCDVGGGPGSSGGGPRLPQERARGRIRLRAFPRVALGHLRRRGTRLSPVHGTGRSARAVRGQERIRGRCLRPGAGLRARGRRLDLRGPRLRPVGRPQAAH